MSGETMMNTFRQCEGVDEDGEDCTGMVHMHVADNERDNSRGLCVRHAREFLKGLDEDGLYTAECPHCECHFGISFD